MTCHGCLEHKSDLLSISLFFHRGSSGAASFTFSMHGSSLKLKPGVWNVTQHLLVWTRLGRNSNRSFCEGLGESEIDLVMPELRDSCMAGCSYAIRSGADRAGLQYSGLRWALSIKTCRSVKDQTTAFRNSHSTPAFCLNSHGIRLPDSLYPPFRCIQNATSEVPGSLPGARLIRPSQLIVIIAVCSSWVCFSRILNSVCAQQADMSS